MFIIRGSWILSPKTRSASQNLVISKHCLTFSATTVIMTTSTAITITNLKLETSPPPSKDYNLWLETIPRASGYNQVSPDFVPPNDGLLYWLRDLKPGETYDRFYNILDRYGTIVYEPFDYIDLVPENIYLWGEETSMSHQAYYKWSRWHLYSRKRKPSDGVDYADAIDTSATGRSSKKRKLN